MKRRILCLVLAVLMLCPMLLISGTPAKAATSLPNSIYLKQENSVTCTLVAATMMLRARTYLSNNNHWPNITESVMLSVAWINGVGLSGSFTYNFNGNYISVKQKVVSGMSDATLISLLNSHPEGIVLYCGNVPHAVFITDYENGTFYCADSAGGSYSLKRLPLASSLLGAYYSGQAAILNNTTAYWYVSGYSVSPTCEHSYSGTVTKAATCTEAGVKTYTCTKCGDSYTETIPSKGGHSYGAWKTVVEAGCFSEGQQSRSCECGDTQTKVLPMLGHNYVAVLVSGSCVEYEKIKYTCKNCGHSYDKYAGEEWSSVRPDGVPEDQLDTKTQYRYSDYTVSTSKTPDLDGYELISSEWIQTSTGSIQHVKSWPAGFNKSHSYYTTYNKSIKTATETATSKVTVNSDKVTGYIYWHWCRGTYTAGPINRLVSDEWTSEFNTFHTFYSTTNPSSLSSDGTVYNYANSSICTDTYWFHCIPVYTQSYTTYEKQFTYGQWSAWSQWSDDAYTASSTRKVETQVLYRYINSELGEHIWDDGKVTTQETCETAGVITYTCLGCETTRTESVDAVGHNYQEGYCLNCGGEDPDYNFVAAKLEIGTVSGLPGATVTVPVVLKDNPGFAGFTFTLDYDAAALSLTDISKGELLAKQNGLFTPNAADKAVTWFEAVNTSGDGVLLNLTFKISENATPGSYNVTAALKDGKNTNFVNENAKAQRITFAPGAVTVQNPEVVSSIVIQTLPAKTAYETDDTLDTTGLSLKVTYTNGNTKTVTDGFTVSYDFSTAGAKIVMVSYEGKTTAFVVSVTEKQIVKFDVPVSRMVLGNSMEFQFGVLKSNFETTEGYYAIIEKEWADGTVTRTNVPATKWIDANQYWAISYDTVAAKEMADNFNIVIYNAKGRAISNLRNDSVRDYIMRNIDEQSGVGKTLMVDMLNYGAAAQSHFGYNTGDLANNLLTETHKAFATTTGAAVNNSQVQGANFLGTRLILESRIQMQVAFAGLTKDMYAVYSYTNASGKLCNVRVEGKDFVDAGSTWCVDLGELVYADARTAVIVMVYNADGSVHGIAMDSMESYCARNADGKAVLVELMKFSDSAKAYLYG